MCTLCSVGFDIVVDVLFPPNNATAAAAGALYLEELFYRTWGNLTSGRAYQNYPSVQYQPRSRALDMYYGNNLCRLVQIKRKVGNGIKTEQY